MTTAFSRDPLLRLERMQAEWGDWFRHRSPGLALEGFLYLRERSKRWDPPGTEEEARAALAVLILRGLVHEPRSAPGMLARTRGRYAEEEVP